MVDIEPLFAVSAFIAAVIGFLIGFIDWEGRKKSRKKTSKKLDDLSMIIERASMELIQVEEELDEKRQRLKELEGKKERYDALIEMKKDEISAIKMEIAEVIGRSERRELIRNVLISATFYVLGVITTLFLKL